MIWCEHCRDHDTRSHFEGGVHRVGKEWGIAGTHLAAMELLKRLVTTCVDLATGPDGWCEFCLRMPDRHLPSCIYRQARELTHDHAPGPVTLATARGVVDMKHWSYYTHVGPPESDKPIDQLRHFLALFSEVPDDELVKMSTSNVYGDGVVTGLTFGTLRQLAIMIDKYGELADVLDGLPALTSSMWRYEAARLSAHLAAAIGNYPELPHDD